MRTLLILAAGALLGAMCVTAAFGGETLTGETHVPGSAAASAVDAMLRGEGLPSGHDMIYRFKPLDARPERLLTLSPPETASERVWREAGELGASVKDWLFVEGNWGWALGLIVVLGFVAYRNLR